MFHVKQMLLEAVVIGWRKDGSIEQRGLPLGYSEDVSRETSSVWKAWTASFHEDGRAFLRSWDGIFDFGL
jgi:hypothetical protein